MGTVGVVVALLALAGAAWWFMRRPPQSAAPAHATARHGVSVPQRVTSPRRYAQPGDKKLWELHAAATSCEPARTRNGRKYQADDAPALPLPACALTECSCHYVAIKERRTWFRRKGEDRREDLRFEKTKIDRRERDRRKSESGWDDDKRPL